MPEVYLLKDDFWMQEALVEARKALAKDEVPVGAVLILNNKIIARDHNRREERNDATAHAEVLVLRQAGETLGGWRLSGSTLYVTLEPCAMCAGALVLARVERLVFGATDPKGGACCTLYNLTQDERLNHSLDVTSGVLAEECSQLLKEFFRKKRL